MSLQAAFVLALGAAILGVGLFYLARAIRVWARLRTERVVTCPETGLPAAVRIDAPHAAVTALPHGTPDLRLAACSRWPERGPCDEPCLEEARAPESAVAAIAARWYSGEACVYCRQPVREDPAAGHRAAFLGSDGVTHEWSDIAPERLPDALRAGWPVCWNCHVVETFRRTYPQLVTDRSSSKHTH